MTVDIFHDIIHLMRRLPRRDPPLSALLQEARRAAGLSQRRLAQRAKTTQAVIARIELGQSSPTIATMTRLLDAAGFEFETRVAPKVVLDPQVLDDVPRILALTPENRLQEIGNLNRFFSAGRRRA